MKYKIYFLIFSFLILSVAASSAEQFEKIQKKYKIDAKIELIVYIEIDAGEITVTQNKNSDGIFVSGQINKKLDELDIGYDKKSNEFSLTLDRRKWFKSVTDENASKLNIQLPDDVTIDLCSKVKAGSIKYNLGGLALKNFELHNFAGEVRVEFLKQNKIEMESLDIDVKIGETRLKRLSNARFVEGTINGGIGELYIDLSGKGTREMDVEIDLDIGSTTILLPRNFGIKLKKSTMGFLTDTTLDSEFEKRGRYYYSANYNSASKTMYANIHSGIGELRIDLR